jgi:hypothetical protein
MEPEWDWTIVMPCFEGTEFTAFQLRRVTLFPDLLKVTSGLNPAPFMSFL